MIIAAKWLAIFNCEDSVVKFVTRNYICVCKLNVALLQKKTTKNMNAIVTAAMNVAENSNKKTYTHQEVWKNVEKILNTHYGTNYKLEL